MMQYINIEKNNLKLKCMPNTMYLINLLHEI